jgi:7-cyano-7-deazaguanine synthase in queuosine biosynthesis
MYDDIIEIKVPLIDKNNKLCYGVDSVLNKLKKQNIYPSEIGFDIFALATLVFLADTRISRVFHSQDSWTREIEITLPVYDLNLWKCVTIPFSQMLNFLTGDKWTITLSKRDIELATNQIKQTTFDAVSLFSGGMDSLISTINNLAQGQRVALISHAGDGYTKKAQKELLSKFEEFYDTISPSYFDLWMVFDKKIISNGGTENTTRSRSFLFIAYGIFVITGMDNVNKLQVPENGLIALNIPLDDLRVGSHSTRTTHPFYMDLWNKVLQEFNLQISIENPYWNKTKGEMADECLNKHLLSEMIPLSSSCSAPAKARWSGSASCHCGYCVPCLIRRAAMHKAYGFINDNTQYTVPSVKEIIGPIQRKKVNNYVLSK